MAGHFTPQANTGTLFRVEERKSDRHPEFEGEFGIVCPKCQGDCRGWVKAWVKESKVGSKFFSLAFKFREKQP